ncbi:MAG: tail fiber protein [Myxococcota bacterium]|nr:tail fiber protein [Myxococcota bacterium]
MSDPFVAEIRIFAGNFPPTGWAFCNGQLMAISQNTALFSLLGTYYGGDGKTTFALPNLQGAAPLHQGQGPGLSERFQGESSGSPTTTLLVSEIPVHTHSALAFGGGGGESSPTTNNWAGGGRGRPPLFTDATNLAQMSLQALNPTGGSQPHNNLPPYLALNFIIALQGIYPPRG